MDQGPCCPNSGRGTIRRTIDELSDEPSDERSDTSPTCASSLRLPAPCAFGRAVTLGGGAGRTVATVVWGEGRGEGRRRVSASQCDAGPCHSIYFALSIRRKCYSEPRGEVYLSVDVRSESRERGGAPSITHAARETEVTGEVVYCFCRTCEAGCVCGYVSNELKVQF